jgi:AGCS family alanine or glycine:cation symporter
MDDLILIAKIKELLFGWPTIIYVLAASIFLTAILRFIQIRQFIASCRYTLFPDISNTTATKADMTPLQAFINSLSASLGNGSIGGVAVAVAVGGPGAAFWMVMMGFLLMAVRYAEVYLSTSYGPTNVGGALLGGPMVYLKKLPAGNALAYLYACMCLIFGIMGGSCIQTNTIGLTVSTTWGISPYINAIVLFAFVAYIVFGGAHRIVKVSTAIVPIKVVVFFVSCITVLAYHYASLGSALSLIIESAFSSVAPIGALTGFSIIHAARAGINTVAFASEAGLGTAAVIYGGSESKNPVRDSISSMLGVFISTLVCFMIALAIVASGVWHIGLSSTALTVASFNTVFGMYGGWVVTFLSVSFGIGVLVTYAYIARSVWLYVTGGRWITLFTLIYCGCAALGALVKVNLLWELAAIVNVVLLVLNLFGLLYLSPIIARALSHFERTNRQ